MVGDKLAVSYSPKKDAVELFQLLQAVIRHHFPVFQIILTAVWKLRKPK